MDKWGVFCTKKQKNRMMRRIKRAGLDIFEVRPLTLHEKITYLAGDWNLYLNDPHIIMFNATQTEYVKFCRKYRLTYKF